MGCRTLAYMIGIKSSMVLGTRTLSRFNQHSPQRESILPTCNFMSCLGVEGHFWSPSFKDGTMEPMAVADFDLVNMFGNVELPSVRKSPPEPLPRGPRLDRLATPEGLCHSASHRPKLGHRSHRRTGRLVWNHLQCARLRHRTGGGPR